MKRTVTAVAIAIAAITSQASPLQRSTAQLLSSMERTSETTPDIVIGAQVKWTFDGNGHLVQVSIPGTARIVRFVFQSPASEWPSAVSLNGSSWAKITLRGGSDMQTLVAMTVDMVNAQLPPHAKGDCISFSSWTKSQAKLDCQGAEDLWGTGIFQGSMYSLFNSGEILPLWSTEDQKQQCRERCENYFIASNIGCLLFGADPPVAIGCSLFAWSFYVECKQKCG